MLNLVLTDRLHSKLFDEGSNLRLITMRPLQVEESRLAEKVGLKRNFLPSLSKSETEEFFREFDHFWDTVIDPYPNDHPFWRNAVSSKMQEWERSAAYLALTLFTIKKRKCLEQNFTLLVICSSIEEEMLFESFGKQAGYEVWRNPFTKFPQILRFLTQRILNYKHFVYFSLSYCYKKLLTPRYPNINSSNPKQALIASLFYPTAFNKGSYKDPYFGNLHTLLKSEGFTSTYLCNPLEKYKLAARRVKDHKDPIVILPLALISWLGLIRLLLQVMFRRFDIPKLMFLGLDFSKIIKWNCRRFDVPFGLDAEIFFAATQKVAKLKTFKRLIQLYEGNVFERGCIQGFRRHNSGPVVGYSHAVVFPINLKMRLSAKEKIQKPEPDMFICTGAENKKFMELCGNRNASIIHAGCSLRSIPKENGEMPVKNSAQPILIALDGVWSTVSILDWFFEHAKIFKKHKFVIRAHPNVPLQALLNQTLRNLPDNFELSKGDLETNILSCRCVIYRQTSVGIQALISGIPVIHLRVDAPLPCDPIPSLSTLKWTVSTPVELLDALQEIWQLSREEKNIASLAAQQYASDYFSSPNKKKIQAFINESAL
jgi:hypothetical protein